MNYEIEIIIFSKDRPWQLSQTLRSLYKYCLDIKLAKIRVIIKSDVLYGKYYLELAKNYSTSRGNIYFTSEYDFEFQTKEFINLGNSKYIMFITDDCLFFRTFELKNAIEILRNHPEVYNYSYRLSPQLNYCHPANQRMVCPPIKFDKNSNGIYEYNKGNFCFAYPFDLTCSVYRRSDVQELAKNIHFKNPNYFEEQGYLYCLNNGIINSRFGAMPIYQRVVSIVCNRVQNSHNNPIYTEIERSPEQLLELFKLNLDFDDEFYDRKDYNSVHVGDFVLKI